MELRLKLDEMTKDEKMQAIETILDSICADGEDVPSPAWHGEVLRERMEAYKAGKIELMDWEAAKKQLGERFGGNL